MEPKRVGIAIVLGVAMVVSVASAGSAGVGSYEDVAKQAQVGQTARTADDLLSVANDALGLCACSDEFAKRDCSGKTKDARDQLAVLKGSFLKAAIPADAIELGTYDFKKGRFPVTVRGLLAERKVKSSVDKCEVRAFACEREEDETFILENLDGDIEPQVALTTATGPVVTGAVIWAGGVTVPDEERARTLKDSKDAIKGEAIYRVESFDVVSVEDKKLAAKRQLVLKKLADLVRDAKKSGGPAKAQAEKVGIPRMKCVEKMKPSAPVGAVRVKLVGIRLWIEDESFGEYLVSEPPSAVPLAQIRAAAAEEARKAKEKADEEARQARFAKDHPSKKLDGWRNLKFGAAVAEVKSLYPALVEETRPPFQEAKPHPEVKTYKISAPITDAPDVKGVFLRFFRGRLFYFVIGYAVDPFKTSIFSAQKMDAAFSSDLGQSVSTKKLMDPTKRGAVKGMQITWDSGATAAQLTFSPPYRDDPGEVTLHVVDATVQQQVESSR